ncbi:signal peptidase I [Rubellimicrobium arenae]|uniref:signal peptidase I n=1 Tax=Rubellimicrobium arenae TaxID=2817372 RepID=UPI001B317F76|nr:signal peptidase I [Rubellimicrobium arenae]
MARSSAPEPLSPARLFLNGFDPSGRTRPGAFGIVLGAVGVLWATWSFGPLLFDSWGRGREALAALALAIGLVPGTGHAMRRLNDMGWSGWWAWVLALPWARWALLAVLVLAPSSQRRRPSHSRWRVLGLGVSGGAALVVAGSLLWTTAPVLAQGMRPTLLPGDLVLVRRAPVALERGDVVAVLVAGSKTPRLGRIISLGGERVAVEGGVPVIDGAPASRSEDGFFTETFGRQGPLGVMPVCGNGTVGLGAECRTHQHRETLPQGRAYPILDVGPRPLDRAEEVAVPPGMLYLLGDDRDAAQDSRLAVGVRGLGLVALDRVIGRVDVVIASSEARFPWDPRGWRLERIGRIVR